MTEAPSTQWYAAVVVHVGRTDAVAAPPLYDESVVLLLAESEEHAREKAELWARGREHNYLNADGNTVSWTLETVVDVAEVLDDQLADGFEVYSRFFRDYSAYRMFEPLLDGRPL